MIDSNAPIHRPDVADLLADTFPGHTMQRMRTPDGKYRYIYVSSGVEGSFGLNPSQLMQASEVDHAWVHPEDRARFVAELEQSAKDLTPLDTEVRVESPSGGYRWVRSLGKPRRQDDGAVIWDGVALDVTDRREALGALERALAEARRSEVAEGRFNYIAAKDLATPLISLREAVAAISAVDRQDPDLVNTRIAELSDCFGAFEKALLATRGLVLSSQSQDVDEKPAVKRTLTKRQREIFGMVQEGASNREIATQLAISEGTVKLHVSAILKRLAVRNRTEAARLQID
ncbi:MAG: LuxR C-terminal-related transcriptional regulator [Pseudomonadota bacterium]